MKEIKENIFKHAEEFNREFEFYTKLYRLDARSYEELKENPEKYFLYESEDYIHFFAKERAKDGHVVGFIGIMAIKYSKRLNIKSFLLDRLSLEYLSKEWEKER